MALSQQDKIRFLANILGVAHVDKELAPPESEAVEKIRRRINASLSDLNKAIKEIGKPGHAIEPVGSFADQVWNLENIVLVAMANGRIHKTEKPVILNFARQVGLTKKQLETIISDVKKQRPPREKKASCPNCEAMVPGSSGYCPQCGATISR